MPCHGILDIHGKTATLGGTTVPFGLVRAHGLRRGDEILLEGQELISVNGADPGGRRPEFDRLTPVHPDERLVLETGRHQLTTRVLDLAAPIGKGQRALVVAPPRTGKTSVLQAIALGVATNHPDVHLMVLLADERPEEVTDITRSVRGEVIASTFDRAPAEHTAVAELALERAKRLVEPAAMYVVLLLGSVPSIANGLVAGIDQIPPILPRVGKVMGAGRLATARHILLPAALPGYLAGLKQGWAFSWRSLMAAEIIATSPLLGKGLGAYLDDGRFLNDMSTVIAAIFLILLVGVGIELLVFRPLERAVLRARGLGSL